jgi:hypothetical protein
LSSGRGFSREMCFADYGLTRPLSISTRTLSGTSFTLAGALSPTPLSTSGKRKGERSIPSRPARSHGCEAVPSREGAVGRLSRGELCWFHHLGSFELSIVGPRSRRSHITLDNPRERYARPVGPHVLRGGEFPPRVGQLVWPRRARVALFASRWGRG